MTAKPIVIDFDAKNIKLVKAIGKLKPYPNVRVEVYRYNSTPISQSFIIWLETPADVVDKMEDIIMKDPYMWVLESGITPGHYDWAADVYNRDHCWVKYIIAASKP